MRNTRERGFFLGFPYVVKKTMRNPVALHAYRATGLGTNDDPTRHSPTTDHKGGELYRGPLEAMAASVVQASAGSGGGFFNVAAPSSSMYADTGRLRPAASAVTIDQLISNTPPPSVRDIADRYGLTARDAAKVDPGEFQTLVVSEQPIRIDEIQEGDIMMTLKVDQSLLAAFNIKFEGGIQVGHTALGVLTSRGDFYTLGFYPASRAAVGGRYASPDPLQTNALRTGKKIEVEEAIVLNAAGVDKLKKALDGPKTGPDYKGRVWTKTSRHHHLLFNNCLGFAQEFNLNKGHNTPLGEDWFNRNASDYGNLTSVGTLASALIAYLVKHAIRKKNGTADDKRESDANTLRQYATRWRPTFLSLN